MPAIIPSPPETSSRPVRSRARVTRAERQARTRQELIDAADRVFTERGFHGASLDLVSAEAGYTKGAVYSNFASKEDLFFAVYERRADRTLALVEGVFAEHASDPRQGAREVAEAMLARRDPGWLAAFFEFWAHVLRHPELRARFAEVHRRVQQPLVEAGRRAMDAEQIDLQGVIRSEEWTLAFVAMSNGIALEQLTDPKLKGGQLVVRMHDLVMEGVRAVAGSRGSRGKRK